MSTIWERLKGFNWELLEHRRAILRGGSLPTRWYYAAFKKEKVEPLKRLVERRVKRGACQACVRLGLAAGCNEQCEFYSNSAA